MDLTRLNRIRFRAWRRGFREADLILGGFADGLDLSTPEERLAQFERLLEQPDHDIYAWIMGSASPPPQFDNEILASLRAFRPGPSATGAAG